MKTIFYQCESDAARQAAETAGLLYLGRQRLNVMHIDDGPLSTAKAMEVLGAIRDESDYFRGWVQVSLEKKG
ncbi:hypothetical protein D0962_34370 [Leptolyngbyaceae cyanobacterium CCMR0082]|uniref:Uncharacterized protein n=1 Tax=Adonisia turfae CCMR0082 TaxID=2304604 RepID=A0A6M0SH13_9CYAN|nr:hypothetical protein [Adonisia turfae]NEZ67785.1 hypothetical protein [Adonisia turfae CCMR0082]